MSSVVVANLGGPGISGNAHNLIRFQRFGVLPHRLVCDQPIRARIDAHHPSRSADVADVIRASSMSEYTSVSAPC